MPVAPRSTRSSAASRVRPGKTTSSPCPRYRSGARTYASQPVWTSTAAPRATSPSRRSSSSITARPIVGGGVVVDPRTDVELHQRPHELAEGQLVDAPPTTREVRRRVEVRACVLGNDELACVGAVAVVSRAPGGREGRRPGPEHRLLARAAGSARPGGRVRAGGRGRSPVGEALGRRALAAPDLEPAARALPRPVAPLHPGGAPPAGLTLLGRRGRVLRLQSGGLHRASLRATADGPVRPARGVTRRTERRCQARALDDALVDHGVCDLHEPGDVRTRDVVAGHVVLLGRLAAVGRGSRA